VSWQQLIITIKRNKFLYYVQNLWRQILPAAITEAMLPLKLSSTKNYEQEKLLERVNYYNKLLPGTELGLKARRLDTLKIFQRPKAYNFDIYEFTRYFSRKLKACFLFGDITYIPDEPALLKSRPIAGNNANGVILKLDKKRHFVFIKDQKPFAAKKNMLIGRGGMYQPHRIRFMEMYYGHSLCNLGQVNTQGGNARWIKPKISITVHLDYKFILSLEGEDVATNLKWVMSSNSIAVMPRPKFETWFMEGKLVGGEHYIEIKDDYSDLEEKLRYYLSHEDECLEIIANANRFVAQFFDRRKENLISLLVLKKYFSCTGQLLQ
jgi:hypothetical protein